MPSGFQRIEQPLVQMSGGDNVEQAEKDAAIGPGRAQCRDSFQARSGNGQHRWSSRSGNGRQAAWRLLQLHEGRERMMRKGLTATFRPPPALVVPAQRRPFGTLGRTREPNAQSRAWAPQSNVQESDTCG